MPTFRKDDIEIAVVVEVTDAHVGRGFRGTFQQHSVVETWKSLRMVQVSLGHTRRSNFLGCHLRNR